MFGPSKRKLQKQFDDLMSEARHQPVGSPKNLAFLAEAQLVMAQMQHRTARQTQLNTFSTAASAAGRWGKR